MFEKDDNSKINEKIIFKEQPNVFFSCYKAFFLVIFLGAIFYLSQIIINTANEIQLNLARYVVLPLTSLITWFIIIVSLLLILWIAWIFLKWKCTEYIVTNSRIISKSGVVSKKRTYMSFNHIQDITISQNIIERIFSVGDVHVFSAYDGTDIKFNNIHHPDNIEKILNNEIDKDYYQNQEYRHPHQNFNDRYPYNDNSYHPDFRNDVDNFNERRIRNDRLNEEMDKRYNPNPNNNNNHNQNYFDDESNEYYRTDKPQNLKRYSNYNDSQHSSDSNVNFQNDSFNNVDSQNFNNNINNNFKNHDNYSQDSRFQKKRFNNIEKNNKKNIDENKSKKDSIIDNYSKKFKSHDIANNNININSSKKKKKEDILENYSKKFRK